MRKTVSFLLAFLIFNCIAFSQIDKMRDQLDDVTAEEEGLMTLRFINSLDGQPVPEASITIQDYGTFKTDLEGKLRFEALGKDGRYPFRFEKKGFISEDDFFEVIAGTIFYNRFSVSSSINKGTYRIVLDWDKKPKDLDAHLLKGDQFHISYRHQVTSQDGLTSLDLDARDGYGPETITIRNLDENASYDYYVHDYTNKNKKNAKGLYKTKARVKVYGDGKLLYVFRIQEKIKGNAWDVFRIVNGQIVPVDEVRNE